jgi:DNA-binding protein HU-beta
MSIIKETMANGENVYLRGFGTFNLKKRAAKTARNITKKETLIVPEHFIPAFKACPEFLNMVADLKELKKD